MGLDCSHDAWHGAYSAFMKWRMKLAEVAGLPPLELMEGFYVPIAEPRHGPATFYPIYPNTQFADGIIALDRQLPIRWECLRPSPLHELLYHSDCDGDIPADSCGPIADALEDLLPLLPDEDAGGHIGNWREKTQQFIKGLRAAAAVNEPLDFH